MMNTRLYRKINVQFQYSILTWKKLRRFQAVLFNKVCIDPSDQKVVKRDPKISIDILLLDNDGYVNIDKQIDKNYLSVLLTRNLTCKHH